MLMKHKKHTFIIRVTNVIYINEVIKREKRRWVERRLSIDINTFLSIFKFTFHINVIAY